MDLYIYITHLGMNIPISVEPLLVYNLVPTEDEIGWEVKRLCNHHSRGLSRIQGKHLKRWLVAARKAKKDVTTTGMETTKSKGTT